jgi:hypothetical protein
VSQFTRNYLPSPFTSQERLDVDRSFIGLNVTTGQKFPAHCPNDRHEQFTDRRDPTAERDSGKLQFSLPFQHRALTKPASAKARANRSSPCSFTPA